MHAARDRAVAGVVNPRVADSRRSAGLASGGPPVYDAGHVAMGDTMRVTIGRAILVAAAISGAVVAAAPVLAQTAPQVYRLSPEEVLRLQERTAGQPDDAAIDAFARPRDGKVHGEVGVGIGTGGYRSIYGAMDAPLGETGSASIAFESTRFDDSLLYGRFRRGGGERAR